jgi:hypothetical protein
MMLFYSPRFRNLPAHKSVLRTHDGSAPPFPLPSLRQRVLWCISRAPFQLGCARRLRLRAKKQNCVCLGWVDGGERVLFD